MAITDSIFARTGDLGPQNDADGDDSSDSMEWESSPSPSMDSGTHLEESTMADILMDIDEPEPEIVSGLVSRSAVENNCASIDFSIPSAVGFPIRLDTPHLWTTPDLRSSRDFMVAQLGECENLLLAKCELRVVTNILHDVQHRLSQYALAIHRATVEQSFITRACSWSRWGAINNAIEMRAALFEQGNHQTSAHFLRMVRISLGRLIVEVTSCPQQEETDTIAIDFEVMARMESTYWRLRQHDLDVMMRMVLPLSSPLSNLLGSMSCIAFGVD
ncbi:hypothetical protein N7462_001036 [Penicillium macrosclerotiorum]|uniref:uncharacterized protein n=1 Tax=Penicillium macrosclerotiorum TaxID=303699 RepID=UPI002548E3C1|nr:uncharacterized protein N7462_001036 [Penicillium macrosclerotiorum]KAJ5699031.1 hypothetical protein N7462_001036 [Penicillium macrosclerotiorum]